MVFDFFPGMIDPMAGFLAYPDFAEVNLPTPPSQFIEGIFIKGTPTASTPRTIGGTFDNP